MRRTIHVLLLALVAGAVLAGCDSDRRAISRDDLPTVPSEPDHVVELGDAGFDPDELDVTTAELVEFRVTGDDDHGVRLGTRIDTGLLHPGESTFVIFDQVGSHEVVDIADADHVLRLEVAPAPEG